MTRRQTSSMGAKKNRLCQWRVERGLTQEQLAEKLGLTYTQIGKIERGVQGLREEHVWKLAELYDCHPGELFEELPTPDYPEHLLELAAIYARMTDEQRRFWIAGGQAITEQNRPPPALKEAN